MPQLPALFTDVVPLHGPANIVNAAVSQQRQQLSPFAENGLKGTNSMPWCCCTCGVQSDPIWPQEARVSDGLK